MLDPDRSGRRIRVRGVALSAPSLVRRLASLQQALAGGLILLFAGFSIWIFLKWNFCFSCKCRDPSFFSL